MEGVIDIYSKIIIAFFGFVAPSFTLLISLFTESIDKKKKINENKIAEIEKMAKEGISKSHNLEKEMTKNLQEMKKAKKIAAKEINLLNPKRQVLRIFIPLFSSLFFLMAYKIVACFKYPFNVLYFEVPVLIISFFSFVYAVYVLWQIFETIIGTKLELIKDKQAEILAPVDITEVLASEMEIPAASVRNPSTVKTNKK